MQQGKKSANSDSTHSEQRDHEHCSSEDVSESSVVGEDSDGLLSLELPNSDMLPLTPALSVMDTPSASVELASRSSSLAHGMYTSARCESSKSTASITLVRSTVLLRDKSVESRDK